MKLVCSLRPRSDGTVVFEHGGAKYVFALEQGELVGDVGDKDAAAQALATGNFYPATEADEQDAEALLEQGDKDAAGGADEAPRGRGRRKAA